MNQVFWSPRAEDSYLAILEYTYFHSDTAALNLDARIENLLRLLQKHKRMCPPAPSLPNVRRCVVTEHVSLAYEIVGSKVNIIAVVDNRMKPLL